MYQEVQLEILSTSSQPEPVKYIYGLYKLSVIIANQQRSYISNFLHAIEPLIWWKWYYILILGFQIYFSHMQNNDVIFLFLNSPYGSSWEVYRLEVILTHNCCNFFILSSTKSVLKSSWFQIFIYYSNLFNEHVTHKKKSISSRFIQNYSWNLA